METKMTLISINTDKREQTNITETGMKVEGGYENTRNSIWSDMFKSVIREVYNVQDVIIAHHLVYVKEEKHSDGFNYQIVEEIPAADTLIFDHEVARKLFGEDFKQQLMQLACEPVETRDSLFAELLDTRRAK
jgi:hypothetical protein